VHLLHQFFEQNSSLGRSEGFKIPWRPGCGNFSKRYNRKGLRNFTYLNLKWELLGKKILWHVNPVCSNTGGSWPTVAREQLCEHVSLATRKHAIMEEMLLWGPCRDCKRGLIFRSSHWDSWSCGQWEAGSWGRSRTLSNGNVRRWKPLLSNG
jgi:hypothetical protein